MSPRYVNPPVAEGLCPKCGERLCCPERVVRCACGQYAVNKRQVINGKSFLIPRRAPNKKAYQRSAPEAAAVAGA